jgi:hypothetical protein
MNERRVTLGEVALLATFVAFVSGGLTHAYDTRPVASYLGEPSPFPTDPSPSAYSTGGEMNVPGNLFVGGSLVVGVGGNLVVGGNVRANSITAHIVADDHHTVRCEMIPR